MDQKTKVNFYRDALLNAPYAQGILFLARQVQRDKDISNFNRSYLMHLASDLYKRFIGLDLYFDL